MTTFRMETRGRDSLGSLDPGSNRFGKLGREGKGIWRPFFLNLSLIATVFMIGIFVGVILRTNALIQNQVIAQARAHFKSIVLTRRWCADYGGVYVKKGPGVVSNPYLENPDFTAVDGTVYTKKNPALMTREVSNYAAKDGNFQFHITSLRPLNPDNQPTPFERQALAAFERGEKERYEFQGQSQGELFVYMAPLPVETSCLTCHGKQGYKVGDIRGGISVNFDVTEIQRNIALNHYVIVGLSVISVVFFVGILYLYVRRTALRLREAYRLIEKLSVTDELTQIYNRRFFHQKMTSEIERSRRYRHPVGLIMMDIDKFKKINDTYGHQTGDAVLREVAAILKDNIRQTDTLARFGGEEMVVILPETSNPAAGVLAEKLRGVIEAHTFTAISGTPVQVTISLGLATYDPELAGPEVNDDLLVKQADEALYRAKHDGRNCWRTHEPGVCARLDVEIQVPE